DRRFCQIRDDEQKDQSSEHHAYGFQPPGRRFLEDTLPFFLLGELSKSLLDAGKRRDDRRGGGSRRRCRMRCLRSPKHAPCGRHLDFQPSPEAEDFVQEPSHFGTSTSQSQVMLSSNSVATCATNYQRWRLPGSEL